MAKYAPLSPPIQGMPIAGLDQREVKTLPGYQDDWDLLQENLESSGMFPFAPGLGDAASELGDLILYSASGKGRDGIDRVNDLDRFMTLGPTWAGQAAQEFGGLLQMTPEQLVQLRRSLGALFSGDPEAKAALWEGVKHAASGYGEDPMSLAEDVGPINPVMGIAAAGRGITGAKNLLSGLGKKTPKIDLPEGQGLEKLSPKTPSDPLAPEVSAQQLASYHMPQAAGWDVDNIDADQWDNFVHSNDPDAIKITHTELDVAEDLPPEGFPGGAGDSAFDYETQKWVEGVPALDMKIKQIKEELEILKGPKGDDYAFQVSGADKNTAIRRANNELDRLEKRKAEYTPDVGKDPAKVQKGGLVYDDEGMFDIDALENKYKEYVESDMITQKIDIESMSNQQLMDEVDEIKQILQTWPAKNSELDTGYTEALGGDLHADFKTYGEYFIRELHKRRIAGTFKDPDGKYAFKYDMFELMKGSDVVDDFPLQGTNVDDALKGIPINKFDNKTLDAQISKLQKSLYGYPAAEKHQNIGTDSPQQKWMYEDLRRLKDERARRGGSDTPETPKFDNSLVVGKPSEKDLKLIKTAWHNMSAKSDADIQKNIEKLHDSIAYKSYTEDWDYRMSLLNVLMNERSKRVAAGTWVYP